MSLQNAKKRQQQVEREKERQRAKADEDQGAQDEVVSFGSLAYEYFESLKQKKKLKMHNNEPTL